MISDVLSDAATEIREYLDDPVYAKVYDGDLRARVEGLVKGMDQLREELDTPPAQADLDWLKDKAQEDMQEAIDHGADKHAVLFGLMCDVIERAWQHWPVESWVDDVSHTSDYARAAAARIYNALGFPWPEVSPEQEAQVKAYREKFPDETDAGTVPVGATAS